MPCKVKANNNLTRYLGQQINHEKHQALPVLPEAIVDFLFLGVPGDLFDTEKCRGFLANFLSCSFPRKQGTKSPRIIQGKFRAFSGQKFGSKIRKTRGLVLGEGEPGVLCKPAGGGGLPTFRERSGLCRGRFRDCSP